MDSSRRGLIIARCEEGQHRRPADKFRSSLDGENGHEQPKNSVREDELHAYVDDELPAERRGDVEAWLATHADDAERVRSWRAMAEALHARYDAVPDAPGPK